MSVPESHCAASNCKNGNCIGCKDGKKWCDDPRCYPYCRDCNLTPSSDGLGYLILLIIAIGIITIIVLVLANRHYSNQEFVRVPIKQHIEFPEVHHMVVTTPETTTSTSTIVPTDNSMYPDVLPSMPMQTSIDAGTSIGSNGKYAITGFGSK